MKTTQTEAIAADGKYIHRVGDSAYFTRCTLLNGETLESFEEVDTIPEQPIIDYSHEVQSLIHEIYSIDDEIALLRQKDTKPDEFQAYTDYCEECKAKVKSRMLP